jgi:hypothetical protein
LLGGQPADRREHEIMGQDATVVGAELIGYCEPKLAEAQVDASSGKRGLNRTLRRGRREECPGYGWTDPR